MERRRFSAEEKLQILEEGRAPGASIAEVCRRYRLSSTLFYMWEKQAKQAALEVLRGNGNRRNRDDKVERLREKIQKLNAVIGEITEENLTLKKRLVE